MVKDVTWEMNAAANCFFAVLRANGGEVTIPADAYKEISNVTWRRDWDREKGTVTYTIVEDDSSDGLE